MRKFLSILLVLITLMGLVLPASAADSLTDMQKAVVETAAAFHFKGYAMQYDSTVLTDRAYVKGGSIRNHKYTTPEEATSDRNIFTVCSSFCFEVYYNALGYELMGNSDNCVTKTLYGTAPEDMVIVHFNPKDDGEDKRQDHIDKLMNSLQPGDIVVTVTEKLQGHAMLYCGDVLGDGKDYIIHSSGNKVNMETGEDAVENTGNIYCHEVQNQFLGKNNKGRLYKNYGFCLLRPLQSATIQGCKVTEMAKTRMQYPKMVIDRTVSCGFYGSAEVGGELTYTLKIENHAKQDYTALPISETAPEGTTLVSVDGKAVTSGQKNANWTLDVPAGKNKTVKYTVKVDAPLGSTIINNGGKVGNIPSNTLKTKVGGKNVDKTAIQDVSFYEAALKKDLLMGTAVANSAYRHAMGTELELPTVQKILDGCFTVNNDDGLPHYAVAEKPKSGFEEIHSMLVPGWVGGKRMLTGRDAHDRIVQLRASYLEPGDVLVVTTVPFSHKDSSVYFCTGARMMYEEDGGLKYTTTADAVSKLLKEQVFFVLRPRLAYEDIRKKTNAPPPFIDVKPTDWFYGYVRELAKSGTISGMTETTYAPDGTLTYGQALKLTAITVGKGEQAATGAHWASGYLDLAKKEGWLKENIDLNANISRLAFCQIVSKASGITKFSGNPFTDTSSVAVLALYNAGIINGMTETAFQPDGLLTRAQVAKIIWLLNNVI